MLDPEYILRLSEKSEEIASMLHSEIVNSIVRRVMIRLGRKDNYILTSTDAWQMNVLRDAGYLGDDIQKEIAQKTKLQYQEIKAAFEDAGVKSLDYDNAIYTAAGLYATPLKQSPYLMRLMQRGYETTLGEWDNFTRTTANAAQRLFITECDKAYHLVTTGALSYTQAVKNAVKTISSDGVTVTYPSGHTDTIETATMRAVRTGVSQSCAEITLARMDEMGWDTILVSSHLGARYGDGGDNHTNHAWWQGKFYSKSGTDKRFKPFSVCGYGDVQGICGANCRHHISPGDGEHNPFTKYDSADNQWVYDRSQEQRKMERAIRKKKREVMGLKTALDHADPDTKDAIKEEYSKQALRLQEQNAKYNAFCKETGLKRLQDRLSVAAWDRKQASSATAAAKNAKK